MPSTLRSPRFKFPLAALGCIFCAATLFVAAYAAPAGAPPNLSLTMTKKTKVTDKRDVNYADANKLNDKARAKEKEKQVDKDEAVTYSILVENSSPVAASNVAIEYHIVVKTTTITDGLPSTSTEDTTSTENKDIPANSKVELQTQTVNLKSEISPPKAKTKGVKAIGGGSGSTQSVWGVYAIAKIGDKEVGRFETPPDFRATVAKQQAAEAAKAAKAVKK